MKTVGTPHWYISGPHSGDYYLLLDERSDHIFATRLAEHIREVSGTGDERAGGGATDISYVLGCKGYRRVSGRADPSTNVWSSPPRHFSLSAAPGRCSRIHPT